MSDLLPTRPNDATTMWTEPAPPPEKQEHDPLFVYRLAHRALRGRYWLAIVLGLAGALAGAVYIIDHQRPVYRSEGLLRIPFRRAPLSDEAEKLRQMTVFQEFLRSQVEVISSRPVIERAITKWIGHPEDETDEKRAGRFAQLDC